MRGQIISEIRRLAKENSGKAPGVMAFERLTGIREAAWRGVYWARWSDALSEAGFAANKWQGKHESELVFQSFIEACRHYKRIPTVSDLRLYARTKVDFPDAKSIFSHFGSKDALLGQLREWLVGKPDLSDVLEMVGSHGASQRSTPPQEGLVYLIKSGAHFKIGRSEELERRVKEIRIALPEAATLVHTISTDDPSGIEAYWHRRFNDKRANGEWFKLSRDDVAAFKRRKFQ